MKHTFRNLKNFGLFILFLLPVSTTVERDKNHPCILIRSIGNENPFTPLYNSYDQN
ncbi:MAG TPA: glycoside hydrolase family 2 TIM barrel-domain containing protein [Paludibacteraceae bacterium]|nr:glycoside hydrolase family 2 TIM barrel-domain containing protein [Paludibacteraceae bacterium]HPT43952.1 glycoside hydrolase family 2 TIM barrel-domain containing protein [Paludibacteraceae bacterium]